MRNFALFLLASLFAFSAFAKDMYVFKRGHDSLLMGGSIEKLEPILSQEGDFIWYQLDGKAYMIRDRAVLAEAARAYAAYDAMQPEYRALEARMRVVEQKEEQLDRQMDRLTDGEDELTAAEQAQLHDYEAAMRGVERELRPLEEEERRLDEKQEALERVAEAELRKIVQRAVAQKRF